MSNGKKDAMIEMVRITPDWVSKLMYQKIAYWTNNDPTKEIICPTIKNVILRCQCFMIFYPKNYNTIIFEPKTNPFLEWHKYLSLEIHHSIDKIALKHLHVESRL